MLSKEMLKAQRARLEKSDMCQKVIHKKDGEIEDIATVLKKIQKMYRVPADNTEEIYQNLPEEQKQAFDHCIDLGQIEEAGEILAGQEREKKSRH